MRSSGRDDKSRRLKPLFLFCGLFAARLEAAPFQSGFTVSNNASVAAFWPRFLFVARRSEADYETPEDYGRAD
jgi:hypothetical protein